MKKFGAILVLVAAMVFSASFVSAEEKEKTFSVDISTAFLSQYVGGLSGSVAHDDFVIQPDITVTHNPSGLYFDMWGSYSPNGREDFGDEIDYIVGISRDIGSVNLGIYYAYYNCYKLGEHTDGDVHAVGTTITLPKFWGLEPYIKAEYDWVVGFSDDNGLMYKVGGSFSPIENLTIDLSAGGHTEIYGTRAEEVAFGRLTAAYEIKLAENLCLVPEINFQKRLGYSEENGGMTKDNVWGGITLSWSF